MPSYTPEELAIMQQYLAATQGGGTGAMDPSLDPYMDQFMSSLLQYPVTSKGNPEYYDVDTQNKMQNALQDRQQTLFNPGNAMMTGGFAPDAFQPSLEEKQLDFPETGTLSVLAQTQGLEGTLAGLIIGDPARGIQGVSASQAMLIVKDMIANPAKNRITDDEAASLEAALPQNIDTYGTSTGVDWNGVTKMAQDLAKPFLAEQGIKARAMDPSSGVIERNGKYFQTTETPSPMTDWARKQGLDTPDTQYNADYLRRTDPDFGGVESSLDQGMFDLGAARQTYTANEAERQRQDDLRRKFTGLDQAAMDRFGLGVQGGLQDYNRAINGDMTVTPAWGQPVNPDPRSPWATRYQAGAHVGDPTIEPALGQRTGTQSSRDAVLRMAMANPQTGGPSTDPAQIQQALRDYMTSASREPMSNVAGHPGRDMVGGLGRGPGGGLGGRGGGFGLVADDSGVPAAAGQEILSNLPSYINSPNRIPDPNDPTKFTTLTRAPEAQGPTQRSFGDAVMPTLPGLPQLSAYGDPAAAERAAMAMQILGQTALTKDKGSALRRKAEQAGRVLPKATRPKSIDEALRAAAHTRTNAAQWAYAKSLLPAYLAQKSGRTPFQDEMLARAQSMRAVGSIG